MSRGRRRYLAEGGRDVLGDLDVLEHALELERELRAALVLELREHELLGVHRGGLAEQQALRQVLLVERLEHVLAYTHEHAHAHAHEQHWHCRDRNPNPEHTVRTVQEPEQDHDAVEQAIELLFGHLLVARAQLRVHVLGCTQQDFTHYECVFLVICSIY